MGFAANTVRLTDKAKQVELLKIFSECKEEEVEKKYNLWVSENPDIQIIRIQSGTAAASSSSDEGVIGSFHVVFLYSIFVWYMYTENSPG